MAPLTPSVVPELLTYKAAGQLAGYSPRTLRRMVVAGTFPAPVEAPGVRGRRFRQAAVLSWCASLRTDTASDHPICGIKGSQ